jgi:hypothetical protein
MILRIILFVFLGILFILQLYFGYRIRQSRKPTGSEATTGDEPGLSRQASFRYALFLTAFYCFGIMWAGYEIVIGRLPWLLGIAAIIVAIFLARQPFAAAKKFRPIAVPFSVELPMHLTSVDKVTPEYIATILTDAGVVKAIKNDLSKTDQIGYKEVWRLGLITPEQDRFDPRPSQLSLRERTQKFQQDSSYRSNLVEQIPLSRTAALYNPGSFKIQLNNLTVRGGTVKPLVGFYPGWSYGLSTQQQRDEFTRIRDIQIKTDSPSARNRSKFLPRFLQEDGFPLRESYSSGDPLTSDRGGTMVLDKGKLIIIYPHYFVQRRLIDDRGDLIDIGFDENFGQEGMLGVKIRPSVSERLVRCIEANGYVPVLRYRLVPYASNFPFPILDTPMSMNGWADLFIDWRGKGKLFISKEKTLAEWYEMMEKLRQLLFDELSKKDYHLLGLTKDSVHLNEYLAKKQAILADYYIIQDWALP